MSFREHKFLLKTSDWPESYKDHNHRWGYEIELVNNDEYCGKFLVLDHNALSSKHYHPNKDETFIVLAGKVLLELYYEGWACEPTIKGALCRGQSIRILPGVAHRFQLADIGCACILEVSTPHSDDDVVKIEPSKEL